MRRRKIFVEINCCLFCNFLIFSCSCIFGTPTMYIDLVNQQRRRKLRINPEIAVIGAAPSSQQLLRDIQEVLKVKVLKVSFTQLSGANSKKLDIF